MKVGIDVSAAVYGTGVSDYVINLVQHLPEGMIVPFGYSLRRQSDLKRILLSGKYLPIPPSVMEILWNRLHIIDVETFVGKVDVWHSSDWTEPPSHCPKVTTIHDLSPFLYPTETDPRIVAVHTRKMKWAVAECRKFICVSQSTANDLQRVFSVSADKIVVIPEALPQRFILRPQLTKYTNYLLAIGARQPRKNINILISAYLKHKQSLSPKLIIAGEVAEKVSDPSIIYTGYIPDQYLVDLLAGAQAFVYPSLYEGFGLPILGAFYLQVPVACSNASSLPEVAGEAAIYFDPLDEEDIVNGIKSALDHKSELVKKGTAQLQNFSWAKAAQETVKVYESII